MAAAGRFLGRKGKPSATGGRDVTFDIDRYRGMAAAPKKDLSQDHWISC
jgi:hypothetical protein